MSISNVYGKDDVSCAFDNFHCEENLSENHQKGKKETQQLQQPDVKQNVQGYRTTPESLSSTRHFFLNDSNQEETKVFEGRIESRKRSKRNEPTDTSIATAGRGSMYYVFRIFITILAILILPSILNDAGLQHEARVFHPSPEHFFPVSYGTELYLECTGKRTGNGTILVEGDVGLSAQHYRSLMNSLAVDHQVCIYDRAGVGHSGEQIRQKPPSLSQTDSNIEMTVRKSVLGTAERAVEDLNVLIQRANISLPLSIVSFGLSTMISRIYAQLHEHNVQQLILIDPVYEALFVSEPNKPASNPFVEFWDNTVVPAQELRQLSAAMGWTRIGLILGVFHVPAVGIPEPFAKYLSCHSIHQRTSVLEHMHASETASQLQIISPFRPLASNISRTVLHTIIGKHENATFDNYLQCGLNVAVHSLPNVVEREIIDGIHQVAALLGVDVLHTTSRLDALAHKLSQLLK